MPNMLYLLIKISPLVDKSSLNIDLLTRREDSKKQIQEEPVLLIIPRFHNWEFTHLQKGICNPQINRQGHL